MRERTESVRICYVGKCPVCGEGILPPFSRLSGPVPFLHARPGRRSCRLIIVPAPFLGAESRVIPVRESESLERALGRELDQYVEEGET